MNMNIYLYVLLPLWVIFTGGLYGQSAEVSLPVTTKMVTHQVNFGQEEELRVDLKGLMPGDRYEVYLVQDTDNPPVHFGNLPATFTEHTNVYLTGTAAAGVVSFCLNKVAPKMPNLGIVVVKNRRAPIAPQDGKSVGDTIEIEENNDIDFLLNTVFRKDTCFALFPGNILGGRRSRADGSFLGQTGVFRNGTPTVGIDSGIIVTTGWVQDAVGPNTPSASQNGPVDFFTPMNGVDPDADALVPANVDIYDLVVLEFDFVPTTDTISFNYVFFSEQYCANLAGNVSNDAFGFLLTGPDGTTENIARLPLSNDIVSPATLNPTSPDAAFFLNNTTPAFGDPCMDTPPPPARLAGIGYDGFSTVLTARGAVTPCARHTLKIVVVDAEDALSDSGVLLEAGSFLAGLVNKPEPNTTAEIGVLQPVEGCDTATIKFTRRTIDEPFINRPLFVKYNVIPYFGAEGEATRATDPDNTAGADYVLPESPFVIPAGDTTATLRIPILADNDFGEGLEAFIIRYDGTCDCSENADTFYIQDNADLIVDLGMDQSACVGTDISLTANLMGGNGVYTYEWPDLADTSSIIYTATGRDTTIVVNVTDGCGLMGTGMVNITAPELSGSVTGDFSLCSDPTAEVTVAVEGVGPFNVTLYVDSSGVVTETNYLITDDSVFVFTVDATITVTALTDLNGCSGVTALDTAYVRSANIAFTDQVVQPACNQSTGSISITAQDGNNNFTFAWSDDPTATTGTRDLLPPGIYSVTIAPVIDPSCGRTVLYDLSAPPPLTIDSFQYAAPTCPGETVVLAPVVSGGTGSYLFSWPDSTGTDSLLTIVTQPGTTTYPLIVTDSCGTTVLDSVVLDLPDFSIDLSGRYSLCTAGTVSVPFLISGEADTYTVELQIDSAGNNNPLTLVRPAGGSDLLFDYPATVTVLSIRNSAGCLGDTITGRATVIDPLLAFTFSLENERCSGNASGSISISDVSNIPVRYSWSDLPGDVTSRSGLSSGTYNLRITDAADPTCFRDTSFFIAAPAPLAGSVDNSGANCQGEALTMWPVISGGTAPYDFNWDNGAGLDSIYQVNTLGGTTRYPLLVTDACGITYRDTVTTTFSNTRAAISGNYSVCNAPFTAAVPVLFTGTGPFTFTVRENMVDRTLVASGDTTLTYTAATIVQLIAVQGGDGCSGQAGGIANVTDAVFNVTSNVTDVLCQGEATGAIQLNVNGNNGAYQFTWDNAGLAGPSVTGLRAGTYALTVTDRTAFACSWDTLFTILEPASPIVLRQDSIRDETCLQLGYASAQYSGGTGQLSYSWSNGVVGNILGEVPAGLYTLSVTDENGCEITQSFNIQDRRSTVLADIAASATTLSCTLTSLELRAQQNVNLVNYQWQDRMGADLGTNRILNVTTPGRYYVTVTDAANGCSAVDSIDIEQSSDLLILDLPAVYSLNCGQRTVDLVATATDPALAADYEWTFNGNTVGSAATLAGITTTGTYEVTAIRRDNGCTATAQTTVVLDETPPTVSVPQPLVTANCRTPEVTIGVIANGPNRFAWSTADGNFTGPLTNLEATVDRAGTYRVTVTDTVNKCTTNAVVRVTLDGVTLVAEAGPAQTLVCDGSGTLLTGNATPNLAGTRYRWYSPAGTIVGENRQVFTQVAGDHVLEVIHPQSGCSSFDTVSVVSEAPTGVTYSLQQPPCPEVGGRLFITSVTGRFGPFDFSSPTGEPEPFFDGLRGLPEGTNVLVVTDQLGCTLRDTFQIFTGGTFSGTADDVVIRLGEEAVLGATTNRTDGQLATFSWGNLNDSLACLDCPAPVTSPLETFVATVTITDTNGCVLNLRQNVIVDEQELVYLPSAFSPANQDGVNDIYLVYGNSSFVPTVNYFRIFDRWGNQVFNRENFLVNDPAAGWNGQSPEGRNFPGAVYTYVVSYQRWDGETEIRAGDFTLVR